MNNQSEIARRRALAEIVAPAYAANPKVAGVLLAGSVARGLADGFSDIEIDIYWHTPPTDEDLSAPIERAGWPIVYRHVDEHEWADGFLIAGGKVDTASFLSALSIAGWMLRSCAPTPSQRTRCVSPPYSTVSRCMARN